MKALTLFDPWATLVVLGQKQFETRSWPTSHRGLLAIHVSKMSPKWAQALYHEEPFLTALGDAKTITSAGGCIIGTVEVIEMLDADWWYRLPDQRTGGIRPSVKEQAFGDFSPGRYAWKLANPRRLEAPIPCRGRQRLWTVPEEITVAMENMPCAAE